jgi:hypothetical protein
LIGVYKADNSMDTYWMRPRPIRNKNRSAKEYKIEYRYSGRILVSKEVGVSKVR